MSDDAFNPTVLKASDLPVSTDTQFVVARDNYTLNSTTSKCSWGGYVLELPTQNPTGPHAIPAGLYQLCITVSSRFTNFLRRFPASVPDCCKGLDEEGRPIALMPHIAVEFDSNGNVLRDVPGFAGVLTHWGNWALNGPGAPIDPKTGRPQQDTEGCLLTGQSRVVDAVYGSKLAFIDFYDKLKGALGKGKVSLHITDQVAPKWR